MFSLACDLTKSKVKFLPVKNSLRKQRENNVDFSTIKITSKKVRGNNVDISTREITPKKVRGNNVDFWTIKITPKTVHGNNVNFWTIEITSKKYVEMTWKFIEIWSSTYQRNICVAMMSIRRALPFGKEQPDLIIFFMQIIHVIS